MSKQTKNFERLRAFLLVRAIRDNAVTCEEFSNGEEGHILSEDEKHALTRVLNTVKIQWGIKI